MNGMLKVAAVAILALAVGIGIGPLLRTDTPVGSAPSLSPAPSPLELPSNGPLSQGSYYVKAGREIAPARFTWSVPQGWVADDGGLANRPPEYPVAGWESEVGVKTWIVSHVFTDACQHTTLVDVGSTVDELAAALAAQGGVVASDVTDTTVAGYPARHLVLSIPADLDLMTCTNGKIRFWPGPGPDMSSGECCVFGPGMNVPVDIVDVDGHRWVIDSRVGPQASADDVAALDAVIASIRIEEPVSLSPAPSSATGSPSPAP